MDCSPPGSSVHGDSPGKNTGVGCHDLLQGIFPTQGLAPGFLHCRWILYHVSHEGSPTVHAMLCYAKSLQSCLTLCDPMDCSLPGSSVHGDSPGKNPGVGCHALLQGILPTQGSNPGFPQCRRILYCLSHQGSLLLVKGMPTCYCYVEIEVQVPISTFVDIERA